VDTLEAIHAGLPEPPDIDDRYEHRKPLNVAAEVLSTIECVLEDNLRPEIESLQRSAETVLRPVDGFGREVERCQDAAQRLGPAGRARRLGGTPKAKTLMRESSSTAHLVVRSPEAACILYGIQRALLGIQLPVRLADPWWAPARRAQGQGELPARGADK
jgi:hypothetical protein